MDEPWFEIEARRRLDGFDLDVSLRARGPALVLFGSSGAGKTMLLHMLAGLARPDAGRIRIGNRLFFDAATRVDVRPQERRAGLVFQHGALFPHLTVEDNLRFGLKGARRGDGRVAEMARALGVEGLLAAPPARLSGGERQRVALGRALLPGPELLLLDEPFVSLDQPARETLRAETRAFLRRRNIPFVLVTHDLEEACLMGDEIGVISNGRVLQAGPKEAVLAAPAGGIVAELLAVRNFLPARVAPSDGALRRVEAGSLVLHLLPEGFPEGAETVTVGVRPENVRILPAGRGADKPNRFAGVIRTALSAGLSHHVVIEVEGADPPLQLRASIPDYPFRAMGLAENAPVSFYLPPRCLQVLREGTRGAASPR